MHIHASKPHHFNATADDLAGNAGIGRYVFLPGSDGRAHEIAEHFDHVTIKQHPRGHHLYLGTLSTPKGKIDVASIASGIGGPSIEIILHELFHLGAKRFLRVGTAGSLQTEQVLTGSVINAQASVRDEGTSRHYVPVEYPAIASLEFVTSILVAAEKVGLTDNLHTGIVHCKSSLYGRELAITPMTIDNQTYMELLSASGVLATEMETSPLFIQAQLYNYHHQKLGNEPQHQILAGAILAVVGPAGNLDECPKSASAIQDSIELALETIKTLATQELAL